MLVRWPDDPQEKLLVFRLLGEGDTKTEVVQELAKMMASINFSTDSVSKCAQLLCIVQYMARNVPVHVHIDFLQLL